MKKILLCISSDLGLKIYKLIKKKNEVDIFFFNSNPKSKIRRKLKAIKLRQGTRNIFFLLNKKDFNKKLRETKKKYDFIILVYWPWLVKKSLFFKFDKSINFHPSFLPYGRGWYPHVFSQIEKFPYGVTLHEIDYGIDKGNIWCQKKINIPNFCKSNEIHKIAEREIYFLFKRNYRKIFNRTLLSYKQNKITKYYSKDKIKTLDKINLNSNKKLIDFINHIRIRTWKNKSFCYFVYKNRKKKIKVTIS